MRNLIEADPDISFRDILFFDDCAVNIQECSRLGVTAHHVKAEYGLTWNDFHHGLKQYQKNISRPSITTYFMYDRSNKKHVKNRENTTEIAIEEKSDKIVYDQDRAGDL